jgi:hypothetical protein
VKEFLAAALLAVCVVAIVWWLRARPTEAEQRPSSADAMRELREQVLHGTAADFSIQPVSTVWGVLMETGHEQAAVTLFALADGNASLYFSKGGGVLGGGPTPSINAAARRVVSMAVRFLPALTPTTEVIAGFRPSLERP